MNWEQFEEERKEQLAVQIVGILKKQSPELFAKQQNLEESKDIKTRLIELTKQISEILPFEREEIVEKAQAFLVTNCLLLVEKEIITGLLPALKSMKRFSNWHFTLERRYTPDIVVISSQYLSQRTLLLYEIKDTFQDSRIILLAGALGDKVTENFITQAKGYGLNNIVTGDIPNTPGDRPYTLPIALIYDWEDITSEDPQPVIAKIPEMKQAEDFVRREPNRESFCYPRSDEDKQPIIVKPQKQIIKTEEITTQTTAHQPIFTPKTFSTKGRLVISSSTKGGVGKTTIAITKAVALSNAGIKTCLLDFNLAAPDIATFFKIEGVPGIELLATSPFSPSLIMDVLVKINDYLYVLPGPMDTTNPYFEEGKLEKILDFLLSQFPILISDTSPEFWTDERLKVLFERADRVYSILTQSSFSEEEAKDYAPQYIMCGVKPDKIGLILNMYDPELRDPRKIEGSFSANLKLKDKKDIPRIEAIIPLNYRENVKGTHDGKVVDLDKKYNQIHRVVDRIAQLAGYSYEAPSMDEVEINNQRHGLFQKFFQRFKKDV